ncbi:hypothetical protein [uncultured Tateyamaria sp.]|uniref:hypothetical protein n=1 Tax=uncultured Tateyamaria sp. TaxID=455651 RepID=UPI0026139C6F|nr:hypothetical protein [uncultured Tateyamaria sp.]
MSSAELDWIAVGRVDDLPEGAKIPPPPAGYQSALFISMASAGEWPVWETKLVNPSLAGLCGGHGKKVTKYEDIAPATAAANDVKGAARGEFMTDAALV